MKLAVYTTIYPGVEEYLRDWSSSLAAQVDQDFDLWVGLDGLEVEPMERAIGHERIVSWTVGGPGDTPASIRHEALVEIVHRYDAVVLVDSDDILHATRVQTAREMLKRHDLVGCALRLVDGGGKSLGAELVLAPGITPDEAFPRTNVFGLSNSAFRSELLNRCLPIPPAVELVDWYLATRAWLSGARLGFTGEAEMDYRQHLENMVSVLPPFEEARVIRDTERVRRHLELVLSHEMPSASADRLEQLRAFSLDVDLFRERVILRKPVLARYLGALGEMPAPLPWWSWVANPLFKHLWTSTEETT